MKQHFQIPWAQILIVCAALVMAFGMGTSVQVEQEAVGQREAFRRSLQMLDQYLCALSEDLGDPDILALEAPLEDDRIQENLVRVRRTSVALKQDYVSNAGRETSPHPHVYLYLLALEETLLESNYLDLEALSQILTICRSLWDIETGLSYKEIMAQLRGLPGRLGTAGDQRYDTNYHPRRNITLEQNKQRIVVKVGTSTLTHNSGALDLWSMEHLVRTLADLQGMGHEVILVSSGAIAVGTAKLGLSERPKELRMKQAAAAVGQCRMMHIYDKFFSEYNRSMAQILLTGDDVEDPERAEHLSNTFSALLEMGVIPVVNENDSVSSAEIETGRHKDTLSAIVAELCRADLLVLLSDIDGLYDADPKTHPEAKLLHQVTELTPEILEMAGGAGSWRGTGGMATKLSAARIAMEAGCDMVITNGRRMEDLYGIAEGKDIGTRFVSGKTRN